MRRVDLGDLPIRLLPLFQKAAVDCRHDFDELIASLYPPDDDPARLLAGPLSRSPFVSSLFYDCIHLRFVEFLLEGEGVDELVVHSAALRDVLVDHFRRVDTPVRVILGAGMCARARQILRPLVRAAKAAVRFWRTAGIGRRLPPDLPPLTLIDTFLVEGSLRGGTFRDRYFPGLLEALPPEERDSVYFLPEIPGDEDASALMRAAEASGARFLLKSAYLTATDYFIAWLSPLKTLRATKGTLPFGRFDAAPLVRADAWESAWNNQSMAGLINFRFAFRLKEAGVPVRAVVDWFENMLIDRGLVLGFHRAYPGVPIVGYAGYIIAAEQHVYLRTTRRERTAGLVPDRLVVVGPALVDGAKEFDRDLAVEVGPAFRFQRDIIGRRTRPDPTMRSVLLALPIAVEGSLDILELAADSGLNDTHFTVKPHPTISPDTLRRGLAARGRAWPAAFELATGDFAECAAKSDAVAGNNSSTCVEALSLGVPVIVVGNRRGISVDPIPAGLAAEMRRLVFTPQEFAAAVGDLATKDPALLARYAEVGRGVAEACFRSVDVAGVRRLLQLEDAAPKNS